jgi:curli biogenesis system outer membrane secretion channel CsgG
MLFGAWQALGEHVRIDVRVVDTESGRIMAAKDKNINKAIESQMEASTLNITHELLSNILKK